MGLDRRRFVKLGILLTPAGVATSALEADDRPRPPAGDPKGMEAWWGDLEKDEPWATLALLNFADRPADSIAFLEGTLKPLKLEKERLDALLVNLGSADESLWRPAFEELEYFDPRLARDLEDLMEDVVDTPVRQRMVCALSGRPAETLDGKSVQLRKTRGDGHNFFSEGGSWWAEADLARINMRAHLNPKKKWTRAVRAIALLEHIGTPAAVAVLKTMAGGHPLVQPTAAAAEALQRLGTRGS